MGQIVDQNNNPNAVDSWALVSNGLVTNLIAASLDYIQDIQDQSDYLVDISIGGQFVEIGYSYDSVADTFSPPPPVYPSLLQCKMINLQNFNTALQAFTDSYYDLRTQFRFFVLYGQAIQNGLTNRAAYIAPLWNWGNAVIQFAAAYTTQEMAITDPATAFNNQWDFTSINNVPSVTLFGAIQIAN